MRPKPRTFTEEYKSRILDEYENASTGERIALLRREDLYVSDITLAPEEDGVDRGRRTCQVGPAD